ncbi:MAG: winged helix DNA-binding protein [Alphaproteobacteria bacterium]|nr:winged helix DNA-binding protein [Alphaproteobacteria bacterium]
MTTEYNDAQRREYLHMIDRVGGAWLRVFGDDTEFYSANYWDLLTRLWRSAQPVRKTDALGFMTAVKSSHTAGKYMERAIERGYVVETENPEDARSRLVSLSSDMRQRLDGFFDTAVDEIGHTHTNLTNLMDE